MRTRSVARRASALLGTLVWVVAVAACAMPASIPTNPASPTPTNPTSLTPTTPPSPQITTPPGQGLASCPPVGPDPTIGERMASVVGQAIVVPHTGGSGWNRETNTVYASIDLDVGTPLPSDDEIRALSQKAEAALQSFGLCAKVIVTVDNFGPARQ